MLVTLLGYNIVEYAKDGADRSFVKAYVCESSESGRISYGLRCFEVLCSLKYWHKLEAAMASGSSLHLSWERDSHRPFLYSK